MNCPKCGFRNREDAQYCGMCGNRLTRTCVSCGFAVPADYHFCIRCGSRLAPGEHVVAEAVTPAPALTRAPTDSENLPVEPQQLEGERRVATIILADVRGSTDLLQTVGTEAWVEMMNHVFQLLEAEIYRFDGKVDQFRGDGLVAFFGTTVAHEDDPERGVLAAMAMQRALKPYAAQLAQREGIDLSLRVGVNTGEVIVTSVGNDRTYSENTAMGEAIALAARMEQAAEAGTVLVSENTYRLVEQQFDWLPLGEITVKGISQPINVYRPLNSRMSLERTPDFEVTSPLIGRDRELQTLIECIEDLREGRGGIVMLTGERGVGKSLLLEEARRQIARQEALRAGIHDTEPAAAEREVASDDGVVRQPRPRVRELRGRARSYDQSQPYAMWHDLMRHWLGIGKDESRESTRDRLRQHTEALWGEAVAEYYPDLANFLGLPLEPAHAEQIQHLDADTQRQRLFLAVRRWVEGLAQTGPLLITLNDMHWADATSLELLKYCLPLCDYLDLLWVLVFRPERRSTVWEFRHYVETEYPHRLVQLNIRPMDSAQSAALIDQMVGPDVLPEETKTLVIQKAEGNPFFTQELVRSLIANGVLAREESTDAEGHIVKRWRATQAVTTLSLPDSLQGLLMARIDRLAPDEQEVLQRAAVIGSVFWSEVLRAISPDLPDLREVLTALQRAQLISERGRVPDLGIEYVFQSKLIRDAAYESLLSPQRIAYHLRIAEYLERQAQADPSAQHQGLYCGALAYHFQQARRPARELHYTLKNADRAKHMYANTDACQHFTHALQLIDQLSAEASDPVLLHDLKIQRFQVLLGRHQVYFLMAAFEEMRADAGALLSLGRELAIDDPTYLIDALLHQPGVGDYQSRIEIEQGIALAEEALELSQQVGDRRRELESLVAIINQRLALSDPTWQELAEKALESARQARDRYFEARLLVGMGGIYAFGDQPERSMEYLEAAAALAMSEGLEDRVTQMALLNLLGLEYERSGDYYRLLTEYQQERLHASRETGHRPMESQALQAVGRITGIYLGDHAAALNALNECRHILSGTRDEVYPLFHIAQIQIAQADHEGAGQALSEIQTIGEPVQDRAQASLKLVHAALLNAKAARAAARGDSSAVTAALEGSLDLIREIVALAESSPLVSQQYEMAALTTAVVAYLGLAQTDPDAHAQQGYLAQALEAAERAHGIYQRFGFAQIVECVSEEVMFRYSQALAANQQQDLAGRYLRRAYDEMMRKHALIPMDSHFRRTYLEQVPLHREIRAAYATRVGSILTEAPPVWHQAEQAA